MTNILRIFNCYAPNGCDGWLTCGVNCLLPLERIEINSPLNNETNITMLDLIAVSLENICKEGREALLPSYSESESESESALLKPLPELMRIRPVDYKIS